MACAAFRRAMACAGIDALVDSAGTHSYLEGMPPYPLAVAAAKRRGYDLTRMVARRVRPADFRHFDLIVAMDRGNLRDLRTMAPARARRKLRLLLEFADAGRRRDVEDPYGGGALDFETALDVIEGGCRGLARRMARLGNFDAAPREFADGMRAGAAAP
jgi:protein-tyrosine phosphatase